MITEEIAKEFGYDFGAVRKYIDEWKPVKELEFISESEDRRVIRKLSENDKQFFDIGFKILMKERPDLKGVSYTDFSANRIRIGKQTRKLFKFLNDQKLSEEVGKYKLPDGDLYLVVSTNFDDFILAATGNSWRNCNDLHGGDFKYTTFGNIFMDGRFIMYITDLKKKSYKSLESYNMIIRCFGFVSESGELATNIWYPIKDYFTSGDGRFVSVKDSKSKVNKYGLHRVLNRYGFFVYPYLDFATRTDNPDKFEFHDSYIRWSPVISYGDEIVPYSQKIKFIEDDWPHLDDDLWMSCDKCGTRTGNIRTYRDTERGEINLCPECHKEKKEKCEYCGKERFLPELGFTEDSRYICRDCVPDEYKRPDVNICRCGTLIRKRGESECRFCRSGAEDAYRNPLFAYLYKGNKYDYTRHCNMENRETPPGIRFDEEVFSTTEKYIKRERSMK